MKNGEPKIEKWFRFLIMNKYIYIINLENVFEVKDSRIR